MALPARLALQNKDGKPAKGFTAKECGVLIGRLLGGAEDWSAVNPCAFPLGYIVISLDNAKPHKSWQRAQPASRLNVIPANSPDIHTVVEHPLKPFNDRWYDQFTKARKCTECCEAMALASEILRTTTPESIHNDLKTLPDTLRSIIANRGDWADDELC